MNKKPGCTSTARFMITANRRIVVHSPVMLKDNLD
jgi:hypothetical protein